MKSSGGDGEGERSFPTDGFFDLLRRAAIFFGQTADRITSAKARGDYSSRDTCSRDNRLSKTYHRINLDDLWLRRTRLANKWKELEKSLGVRFDSFEMHQVKVKAELILLPRDVDDLPHALDEQVFTVCQKHFADEWMRLRELLAHFSQSTADSWKLEIVNLAHSSENVAFEQIQERETGGCALYGLNDRELLAKSGEPVTKSGAGNLEIDGSLGKAVGRLFVEFVVSRGHSVDTLATPPWL